MSLQYLLDDNRLATHNPSVREVADLLRLAQERLADAHVTAISIDLRYTAAYQAALQLATIVLHCSGYRTIGVARHKTVFESLPHVMGTRYQNLARYYDSCRRKRNVAEYHQPDQISDSELQELIESVAEFQKQVYQWLQDNHPKLLGET